MNRIKKTILNTRWYDQGGAGKLLYTSIPAYTAVMRLHDVHKKGYEMMVNFSIDCRATWGLYVEGLERLASYVWENHLKSRDFIKSLVLLQESNEKRLDEAIEESGNLKELSNSELKERFREFCKVYAEAWKPFIFVDCFDLLWEDMLNDLLEECYPGRLADEEIKTLLMPDRRSYTQEEEISLLKLTIDYPRKGLEKHQKRFFWYRNNYSHIEEQPVSHFRERMEKIKDAEKELEDTEKRIKKVIEEKKEILGKHRLPEKVRRFVDLIVILSKQRDVRKRCQCKGSVGVKRFIKEIAERRKIDYNLLEQVSYPYVLDEAFSISEEELRKMSWKGCLFCDEKKGAKAFYGGDALEIKKAYDKAIETESEDINGTCAFGGKARGKAKIIIDVHEFPKMKEGNILVSYNTRPEFAPIMKKAAAIVTNEGGITCHAAIISRELKIPCVIGTKIATRILKDGDLVEVDADKGIVRKIG